MASTTDFTKQDFINFIESLNSDEKKSLMNDLGYQKIPEKKTKKNKKHIENQPFQPNKCCARILVPEKDSNGDPIMHSTDKHIHFQYIPVQCCSPIHENGLCKLCITSKKRQCSDKGITPFGKYNDGQDPDFYTRITLTSKNTHTYYMKDKPIPDDVLQYKSDSPTKPIKKSKTPKNIETKDDSIDNIDWKQTFIDGKIKKKKIPQLKSFINQNSITIDSDKPKKNDYVKAVEDFLKNKYSDENLEQPQEQVETTQNQVETTQEQVETTQEQPLEDNSTQDVNETNLQQTGNLYDDNDHFAENEDTTEEDDLETIEIQGVLYHISEGFAIDITTGDKLGPIDWDVDDWRSSAKKVHAKNLEILQKNM